MDIGDATGTGHVAFHKRRLPLIWSVQPEPGSGLSRRRQERSKCLAHPCLLLIVLPAIVQQAGRNLVARLLMDEPSINDFKQPFSNVCVGQGNARVFGGFEHVEQVSDRVIHGGPPVAERFRNERKITSRYLHSPRRGLPRRALFCSSACDTWKPRFATAALVAVERCFRGQRRSMGASPNGGDWLPRRSSCYERNMAPPGQAGAVAVEFGKLFFVRPLDHLRGGRREVESETSIRHRVRWSEWFGMPRGPRPPTGPRAG